jgi:serine/threonine protein phosphatase PrpC
LLICSDGLHPGIDDAAILKVLASREDAAAAVQEMVSAARDQGGPDNISCIVIDYHVGRLFTRSEAAL